MIQSKACTRCFQHKPFSEFYASKRHSSGLTSNCKSCGREMNRISWEKHKEKRKEGHKRYSDTKAGKASAHKRLIKYQYGIEYDEYLEKLEDQGEKCYICGKTDNRRLCVDHDHSTGKVRDLLCTKCNQIIGLVNEDQRVLKNMIKYLNKHKSHIHVEFDKK